jgi:hypothetical protein
MAVAIVKIGAYDKSSDKVSKRSPGQPGITLGGCIDRECDDKKHDY